jgi:hypothetical protein
MEATTAELLRLAHSAASSCPSTCRICRQRWPCESRLKLDEVSPAAIRRYAAQVHANWLAGTPARQQEPACTTVPASDAGAQRPTAQHTTTDGETWTY